MSINRFHVIVISCWLTALLATLAIALALGVEMTQGRSIALLLVACLPPVVLVTVFRGAPEPSIGQILYDADHAGARIGSPATQGSVATGDVRKP